MPARWAAIASLRVLLDRGSHSGGTNPAQRFQIDPLPGRRAGQAGAHSVDPAIQVLTSYIGNWEDVGAAKEAALAQIGRGADILIHNADAAGLGVFQAARDSSGVLVFGTNKNQNDLAPEITVASAVLDIPQAFVAAALCRKDGPSSRRDGPFQGTWLLG